MHPVAILCGGKGTRMRASGERLPKPLVEVGGRPILWHVMSLYAAQGFRRLLLLLGHGRANRGGGRDRPPVARLVGDPLGARLGPQRELDEGLAETYAW